MSTCKREEKNLEQSSTETANAHIHSLSDNFEATSPDRRLQNYSHSYGFWIFSANTNHQSIRAQI